MLDRECNSYNTSAWIVDGVLEMNSGGGCSNL